MVGNGLNKRFRDQNCTALMFECRASGYKACRNVQEEPIISRLEEWNETCNQEWRMVWSQNRIRACCAQATHAPSETETKRPSISACDSYQS